MSIRETLMLPCRIRPLWCYVIRSLVRPDPIMSLIQSHITNCMNCWKNSWIYSLGTWTGTATSAEVTAASATCTSPTSGVRTNLHNSSTAKSPHPMTTHLTGHSAPLAIRSAAQMPIQTIRQFFLESSVDFLTLDSL